MSTSVRSAPPRLPTNVRWVGTHEQFSWLGSLLQIVIALNLIDAVLTIIWVHSGRATEANPLLAELVNNTPLLFVLVKMSLVVSASYLLWRHRRRASAVIGIFMVFGGYYALLLYHLQSMQLSLLRRFFD